MRSSGADDAAVIADKWRRMRPELQPKSGVFTGEQHRLLHRSPGADDDLPVSIQQIPFYHRDLSIENVLAQDSGKSVTSLSGQVINRGVDAARAVYVSVILYDDAGRVTAVRRVMADPPELQPGETGFFSAELLPIHLPVADYHLLAEGQRDMPPHE